MCFQVPAFAAISSLGTFLRGLLFVWVFCTEHQVTRNGSPADSGVCPQRWECCCIKISHLLAGVSTIRSGVKSVGIKQVGYGGAVAARADSEVLGYHLAPGGLAPRQRSSGVRLEGLLRLLLWLLRPDCFGWSFCSSPGQGQRLVQLCLSHLQSCSVQRRCPAGLGRVWVQSGQRCQRGRLGWL